MALSIYWSKEHDEMLIKLLELNYGLDECHKVFKPCGRSREAVRKHTIKLGYSFLSQPVAEPDIEEFQRLIELRKG